MKFLNFFLAFFFLTTTMNAQITITNNDMPNVNDTFRLSTTNNIQGLDPVLTGTNYSWNFSTLVPSSQRLDTFFSVSSTPLAYQFYFNNIILYPNHKASYAIKGIDLGIPQVPITEVFNYIKNSSSAYDNVGFGSKINGVPSSTQNNPVDREYTFPMNYNDNHNSNSVFGMSVPTFGYYGQSVERIDTVDGWGTLTLPNANYTVLRVKSILHKIDTTYIDQFGFGTTIPRPEEIEYKWLAVGTGIPVLKIITNAGNVTQIEYQDIDLNVSVAEINEINGLKLFPNPAKNFITIDFESTIAGSVKVKLKDVLGKDIATIYTNNLAAGNNKLLIDLARHSIQSGIYFVELSIDNKEYFVQKLVIAE
ncbi:MAG: hypothetical protein CO118_08385 [Flavobacteriales bacterium CG_4_9_14_3_um_filter_32_8]|nr:MAG: hypothetical protein CO118_08385 [Flavobacteriales bacterium CG_4_9_14_3_um_filter_32_8]